MRKREKQDLLKNIHYLCVDKYDGVCVLNTYRETEYNIDTKYGRLNVKPDIDLERDHKMTTFFIALRFEDTDLLKKEAPLYNIESGHSAWLHQAPINQYAGKWNITMGRFATRQDLYDELDRRLGSVAARQRIL